MRGVEVACKKDIEMLPRGVQRLDLSDEGSCLKLVSSGVRTLNICWVICENQIEYKSIMKIWHNISQVCDASLQCWPGVQHAELLHAGVEVGCCL